MAYNEFQQDNGSWTVTQIAKSLRTSEVSQTCFNNTYDGIEYVKRIEHCCYSYCTNDQIRLCQI